MKYSGPLCHHHPSFHFYSRSLLAMPTSCELSINTNVLSLVSFIELSLVCANNVFFLFSFQFPALSSKAILVSAAGTITSTGLVSKSSSTVSMYALISSL